MELDELKELINEKPISYSREELESIFQIKTKRQLGEVNKKMRVDMILMILTALGIISVAFFLGLRDRLSLSAEVILLVGLVLIHYRIKYVKVNQINLFKYDVRAGVEKSVNSLKFYLKLYKIVIPFFTAFFYSYQRTVLLNIKGTIPQGISEWSFEIGIVLLIMVLTFFLTQWISQRLYGKELTKLETYLDRLDEK